MGEFSSPVRNNRISYADAIFTNRATLLLGFGGLLILLLISATDAIRALSQAQTRNEQIRQEFLARNRRLERIRSELYLSGTYIRDYLLDPDQARAEEHRFNLSDLRREIETELAAYRALVRPREAAEVSALAREIRAYWQTLDPVFAWNTEQRRQNGYTFLREQVFPRRTTMLGIADRIATLNETELNEGGQALSDMFAGVRTRVMIGLTIILLLGSVHAVITARHILRLERATSEHLEQVTEARQELRNLSNRLVAAQEEERKAISRDLHDAVGQGLSAVLLELQNHKNHLQSPELRAEVDMVLRRVESTVAVVRNMMLLLRPSMLDDLGLIPALEWLARETSRQTGMLVEVSSGGVSEELPDQQRTAVFRIVQEALHNVGRHAGARSVNIAVREEDTSVTVVVEDDGKGFRPDRQKGLGLLGMQERVEGLAGHLRVTSRPGSGTRIEITLPVEPQHTVQNA